MIFFSIYNVLTYMVFLYGPFRWDIYNIYEISIFMVFNLLLYILGYFLGLKFKIGTPIKANWLSRYIKTLLLVSIIIFALSIYFYTGHYFWDINRIAANQSDNYYSTLEYVKNNRLSRLPFVAVKVLLQPLILVSLVFATLNFSKIKIRDRIMLCILYTFWILFSVFRGTDKEVFDVMLIVFASIAINYFSKLQNIKKGNILPIIKSLSLFTITLLIVISFLGIFAQRKLDRMNGSQQICFEEQNVCSTVQGDGVLSEIYYAYAIASAYTSQGYYGLSLAMTSQFTSVFPFGTSPVLSDLGASLAGQSYIEKSYIQKNKLKGWDDKIRWSSAYTWWASDVSFWLVPFVLSIVGFLTALSWKEAVLKRSILASTVFSSMATVSMFLSANNQIAVSIDSLFSFFCIIVYWFYSRQEKYRFSLKGRSR